MRYSFKPGKTFFHKIDPITKLIWGLIVAFWLFSLRDITQVLIVSVAVGAFSIICSNLNMKMYSKLTLFVLSGGLFIIAFQGIFRPGTGIEIGFVTLSYSGMTLGLAITLRTFGLVASSLAFSTTTSPRDLELGMVKLGMPYTIARIGYLALRFMPLFERDLQDLNDAYELRGKKKGWDRAKTTIIGMIGTELRSADDMAIALETRGFGLHKDRTELNEFKITKQGILLVVFTLFLVLMHLVFVLKAG